MPPRIAPIKPDRVYLRSWREHEHPTLTQEALGLRFKPQVSKGTISRWENARAGKLSNGVIGAYAEALGRRLVDMYRRPDQGPSLDGMAEPLDPEARKVVVDTIAVLLRRTG